MCHSVVIRHMQINAPVYLLNKLRYLFDTGKLTPVYLLYLLNKGKLMPQCIC